MPSAPTVLTLGTRGSRLALRQTDLVCAALGQAWPDLTCIPHIIRTSGDWKPEHGETRLSEQAGGKGLFVKEIEEALRAKVVHAGVHSLKDMPSILPNGLGVDHVLPRADARDVFISRTGDDLLALPSGAVVGTASLRRQAVVKGARADLTVVTLRGNINTRLEKLRDGQVDAIILAQAGLSRLDLHETLSSLHVTPLDPSLMLPACGQGIIGIETHLDDQVTRQCLDAIHDPATGLCAVAERRVLQILDGDCRTPVGAYAIWAGKDQLHLRAMVARPDGTDSYAAERQGPVVTPADAIAMANDLGAEMRANAPAGILPACRTGT